MTSMHFTEGTDAPRAYFVSCASYWLCVVMYAFRVVFRFVMSSSIVASDPMDHPGNV